MNAPRKSAKPDDVETKPVEAPEVAPAPSEKDEKKVETKPAVADKIETKSAKHSDPKPSREVARPAGQIVQPGEQIKFKGKEIDNLVWLDDDIYEEVYPIGSKRPTYILRYSKNVPVNKGQLEG